MTNPKFSFISFLGADLKNFNELHGKSSLLFLSLFSPRFIPILILRLSNLFNKYKLGPIAKGFSLLNFLLFGIEISTKTFIGKGIFFPHTSGTVIGADYIGKKCTIFQGVTLGAKYLDLRNSSNDRPILLDNIVIGAGAKVLGGIKISSNSIINANSLITRDL